MNQITAERLRRAEQRYAVALERLRRTCAGLPHGVRAAIEHELHELTDATTVLRIVAEQEGMTRGGAAAMGLQTIEKADPATAGSHPTGDAGGATR